MECRFVTYNKYGRKTNSENFFVKGLLPHAKQPFKGSLEGSGREQKAVIEVVEVYN